MKSTIDLTQRVVTGLVLCLLLLALGTGPAAALTSNQGSPEGVAQGYGNFPRLPVIAPTAEKMKKVDGGSAMKG